MSTLVSVAEFAAVHGVHVSTVRRGIAAGRIQAVRVGRSFRVSDASTPPFRKERPAEHATLPQDGFLHDQDSIFDLIGLLDDGEPSEGPFDKHAALSAASAAHRATP